MRLEDIDLQGLGTFTKAKAGFRVGAHHLEEPWGYIYATERLLLRVDQRGPDYVQLDPPAGTILFRRERWQTYPSCFVWIKTGPDGAFSNFHRPAVGIAAYTEPEEFWCDYTPARALYHVRRNWLVCETQLFVPEQHPVTVMTCTLCNADDHSREVEIIPVLRPHLAAAALEPWDVPSLYQTVAYTNRGRPQFHLELRSPAGDPALREYAFAAFDIDAPYEVEVDYAKFVGRGTFGDPEALHGGQFSICGSERWHGGHRVGNSVTGRQGIVSLSKRVVIEPGGSWTFTLVVGSATGPQGHGTPSTADIRRSCRYFGRAVRQASVAECDRARHELMERRKIRTPDAALDRYVNEFLPLQLGWVKMLDRGWPTGMRGTRDCCQDAVSFVPLDPDYARRTLLRVFGVQRSDGWFPRQFSIQGKSGRHDLRNYVDGGAWVWALLFEYLCHTKDFGLLSERVDWLDSDEQHSVLEHAERCIAYFLAPENLGEHGLCKIREGDWNDSVNRAGLEGRGESVMVSCQVVMMLKQAAHLADHIAGAGQGRAPHRLVASGNGSAGSADYRDRACTLTAAILEHALNDEGYLNGVFNDDGKWIFSNRDPDGRRRVNIPVNAFGMISGVLTGEKLERATKVLLELKTRDGWPLYWPPISDPPIEKLGRVGHGDLAPGLGENGGIYNHGSHGFFARGAARSGHGDLALELLRYMLPYDQVRHPVSRSKTAPYGVPNHWMTAPGVEGRGGMCFLSGSISTALQVVYNGLFGITPRLDGLGIDPDLPSEWEQAAVRVPYLGADVEIRFGRKTAANETRLLLDGEEVGERRRDVLLDKEILVIPDDLFRADQSCRVECYLQRSATG